MPDQESSRVRSVLYDRDEALAHEHDRIRIGEPGVASDGASGVGGANRKAASVADLPEAWTVPQRNRAVTRKATILDPASNELSNSIWRHTQPDTYRRVRSISFSPTENR